MFFAWEFDLVKASEFEAIQDIVEELKKKYDSWFQPICKGYDFYQLHVYDFSWNSIEYGQTPVMPLLQSYYQRRAESWTLAYGPAAEYNTGLDSERWFEMRNRT